MQYRDEKLNQSVNLAVQSVLLQKLQLVFTIIIGLCIVFELI